MFHLNLLCREKGKTVIRKGLHPLNDCRHWVDRAGPYIGVRFDPLLNFEAHIKHLCKTSFHHLRNIARLRPSLTLHDAEKLVHAFVSSRLDYCNALLIGIPDKSIQKLQYIQNSAARILMRVRKYEDITPIF